MGWGDDRIVPATYGAHMDSNWSWAELIGATIAYWFVGMSRVERAD